MFQVSITTAEVVAWQVATATQCLCPSASGPIRRVWHIEAKVKASRLGTEEPDEWNVPPQPKGMRWVTCEPWVAKCEAAEEMLDAQLVREAERWMEKP